MIPTGEDWRIRNALGYMNERKVLQWARVTISERICERDISRIARTMPKEPGVVRYGRARDAQLPPIGRDDRALCDGRLAARIEDYIDRLAKLNSVRPDYIKRECYGWS